MIHYVHYRKRGELAYKTEFRSPRLGKFRGMEIGKFLNELGRLGYEYSLTSVYGEPTVCPHCGQELVNMNEDAKPS